MSLTCNEIHQITEQSTHHTKDASTRMKQRCDQHVLESRVVTYSLNSSIVWGSSQWIKSLRPNMLKHDQPHHIN
jgi:hypothetical protein